ncbi:MAG: hypothetical protein Wins2KO_22470 [Winogradskyella sp.]
MSYYSDLALKPKKSNDLFKALKYFNASYKKALNQKNYNIAINLLYYKSSIEYKKGAYEESERTLVKGLSHIGQMNATPYSRSLTKSYYNLLGLIYIEKFDKNKAIELYNKTLEFAESEEDIIKVYNNLSLVYKNHNEYANAKDELLRAYILLPKISDALLKATIYDNLGYIYSKIDKVNGLSLMQKALSIRNSKQDKIKVYTSYNHLSKYFYGVSDTIKAVEYAIKNYKLANELSSPSFRLDALSLLVDLKKHEFIEEFKFLSDSIYKVEKQDLSKYMLVKYDYSEYERKALESQLEKEKQESRAIIAILIALFILFTSLFLYFVIKSKHKKEKLQQVFDTESRISKKVHDDIANDVFQVMTTLQADNNLNQNIKGDIELIYDKARDISKQLGEIDLEGDYKIILNDLALRYNTDDKSVIVKDVSKIAWDKISKTKKTALYKVLQELLINMRKHSKASVAVIAFNSKRIKTVINYSDDGIGCELKKSNGLLNVENRIKAVGGNITFESRINNGFKAKIEI